MEIKTSSWHWRFNVEYYRIMKSGDYVDIEYQLRDRDEEWGYKTVLRRYFGDSLCAYFWQTIGRLILTSLILVLIGVGSFAVMHELVVEPILTIIFQLIEGQVVWDEAYIPVMVVFGFLTVVGIIAAGFTLKEKMDSEGTALIPEYIKARKNKWCPMLTVRVDHEAK